MEGEHTTPADSDDHTLEKTPEEIAIRVEKHDVDTASYDHHIANENGETPPRHLLASLCEKSTRFLEDKHTSNPLSMVVSIKSHKKSTPKDLESCPVLRARHEDSCPSLKPPIVRE